MRNATLAAAALATGVSGSAFATISNQLIGDSYIVNSGGRTYSVMDVYIKCGASTDILSSVFGVSAYVASVTMNQGDAFVQQNSTNANSAWLPTAGQSSYDSFLTAGNRSQTSASTALSLQLDTNWSAGTGAAISGINGGPGWYPAVGANTNTNPYARAGYYNGATNIASCTSTIAGNNIVSGGSLDNAWMIGRFTIDLTTVLPGTSKTMTMLFATAGKNNGVTTVTGATNAAYRYNQMLTFASAPIPAPGAAVLLGLVGLAGRRRR